MAELRLTSPAFDHDASLPKRFYTDTENVSPPLTWHGVPDGTAELVVISEDPDSEEGVFTHWLVYGIPPSTGELPEKLGVNTIVHAPEEMYQGLNDFDAPGWTGPSDEGRTHRMFFRLYALDTELVELAPGATREELRESAKKHVIDSTELVGMVP
jgi:Raf kinase inhibitor-like YbhB/YbcL family protein